MQPLYQEAGFPPTTPGKIAFKAMYSGTALERKPESSAALGTPLAFSETPLKGEGLGPQDREQTPWP